MNTKNSNLLRKIYLYLFSLIGLVLLIIGLVRFVDMGLKAFVFTQADQQERIYDMKPPVLQPTLRDEVEENEDGSMKPKEDITLTEAEKEAFDSWIEDYNKWQKNQEELDSVTSRRHREASTNLALIIIGLPLYLYHWFLIKKES